MITQSPFLEPTYGLQRVLIMNEGEESGLGNKAAKIRDTIEQAQWEAMVDKEALSLGLVYCKACERYHKKPGCMIHSTSPHISSNTLDTPSGFPLHIINNPFLSTPSKDN